MGKKSVNNFGGSWTKQKLEVLNKYLSAYAKILKKTNFKIAYIDAFAGNGYIQNKKDTGKSLFDIDINREEYAKGSVKIALECKPRFDKYIFIEIDKKKLKS